MATRQGITNKAVGFKHLDLPGGMTGVFNQQPAQSIITKQLKDIGSCGARVALQAHTSADATIMAAGECGLSGVVCNECAALAESEDEPGLHGRG
jgi:hypothetical protein